LASPSRLVAYLYLTAACLTAGLLGGAIAWLVGGDWA
jgi:hypothetical protein